MSNNDQFMFPIPPRDSFLRRNIGIIRTAEFSLALTCAFGAWFGGNDAFLRTPVLILGFVFAGAGICAADISRSAKVIFCLLALSFFVAEGAILGAHFQNAEPSFRRLTTESERVLKAELALPAHERHSFQINSVPSCDECEIYAEQLRTFFNTIPGWEVNGGPVIFAGTYPRGVSLFSHDEKALSFAANRVLSALKKSGISVAERTESGMKEGSFLVLIGRRGTN